MRFTARFLVISFLLLIVFFLPRLSFAQDINPQQNTQINSIKLRDFDSKPSNNFHYWTQMVMLEVGSALTCQLTGVDVINPSGKCLGFNFTTKKFEYVSGNGGAIGTVTSMITYLYTPPVEPGSYMRYLAQNFGISKPTYAQTQGSGFNQLRPLLSLWLQFRNISYLLFIFIFVLVGVAIMLRIKINPQTIMTIQNQIPKLIIGLVMITLSYAIAGLVVDLMWLSTYVSFNIINSADPLSMNNVHLSRVITQSPLPGVNEIYSDGGGLLNIASKASDSVSEAVKQLFGDISISSNNTPIQGNKCVDQWILCDVTNWIIDDVVGGIIQLASNPGAFFGGVVAGVVSSLVGFVAFLIFSIAILVSLIKLWFALLKAYIMVLIDIVFAPFWILAGLLPGTNSLGFGNWLRDLLGNIMAFPAVLVLFLIGKVFIDNFKSTTTTADVFVPPLVGINVESLIGPLIALGIILMSPQVVDITKKAFKTSSSGVGLGGGISAGSAAMGAVGGAIGSRLYRRDARTGEIRGAVGTRVQSFLGDATQGSRGRNLRNFGRFTLGVEKSANLGKTAYQARTEESDATKAKEEKEATLSTDDVKRRTGG